MSEKSIIDQREPWQKKPKFNWGKTLLISFGFFASSIAWSQYNSQIPIALDVLLPSQYLLIGFIMTLDNIIGMFLQPIMGNLSDRTKSRFGRRMPFILIGLPISAGLFLLLALTKNTLWLYIIVIFFFVTAMAIWRAPVVSMMPDFVSPQNRSKGNALVNIFGGIASAAAAFVGGILIDKDYFIGFVFVVVAMIVALIILFFGVKEPDTREWDFSEALNKKNEAGIWNKIKELVKEEEKSPIWMLIAIWAWFMTHQAIESLLSLYATKIIGVSDGEAQQLLLYVSISFIIFAFVSSFLSKKLTRRTTILIGLGICILSLVSAIFIKGPDQLWLLIAILIVYGAGWAFININSIAMMWDMATTPKQIGTYTGLYYFASFLAAVLGPISLGYIMEYVAGLEYLLPVGAVFMLIAIIAMLFVKRGEPELTEEQKSDLEKAKIDAK
ncbi:MFS transporter [Promethearchaeum syntrophicum]|uniref:MFS transporter n=1 Tax=Promethearchaeum syntrophicum TaxID=2594042 RepID=A0A5B9D8Y2_9ARCH|nr:MFS transporter [Candidatus Prometheoarchaeum syntrophicum]